MEILRKFWHLYLFFSSLLKNHYMYEAETSFVEKLIKFPFETYIVLNKKYKI